MSPIKPRISSLEYPLASPNVNLLAVDGATEVRGTASAGITTVKVAIFPPGQAAPANPPTDAVTISLAGGGAAQPYRAPRVPGGRGSLAATGLSGNTLKAWFYTGNTLTDTDERQFIGQQPVSGEVVVSARACLWFTWADKSTAITGTPWEPDITPYRPLLMSTPNDATSIKVTRVSGTWAHDGPGGVHTDADGKTADPRPLERPDYKSANFNSLNINELTAPLNKLVALFGEDSPPANAVSQLPVGNALAATSFGGMSRVFLGFHDGYEWSNNVDEMVVLVEWS